MDADLLQHIQGAATQLRQLLDFYFEPFTLQHNRLKGILFTEPSAALKLFSRLSESVGIACRYLLDLILKRASAPQVHTA